MSGMFEQVMDTVADALGALDEEAAKQNDKLHLFTNREQFADVFRQVPSCS